MHGPSTARRRVDSLPAIFTLYVAKDSPPSFPPFSPYLSRQIFAIQFQNNGGKGNFGFWKDPRILLMQYPCRLSQPPSSLTPSPLDRIIEADLRLISISNAEAAFISSTTTHYLFDLSIGASHIIIIHMVLHRHKVAVIVDHNHNNIGNINMVRKEDQPTSMITATSPMHVSGKSGARIVGSAVAGASELFFFHPFDTVAKRLMST